MVGHEGQRNFVPLERGNTILKCRPTVALGTWNPVLAGRRPPVQLGFLPNSVGQPRDTDLTGSQTGISRELPRESFETAAPSRSFTGCFPESRNPRGGDCNQLSVRGEQRITALPPVLLSQTVPTRNGPPPRPLSQRQRASGTLPAKADPP